MHTLQHGLIAILTDSCSTVVPQYKKKNKFSHHTQWATCDEAKLQNSLRGQTGAVWCNQCSEVIVRAVQDQQSVNFLSLISVSCTLTHSLDMHICRLCQHFFPLKLPACFLFLFFSRSTSHDYNSCPPNTAGEAISVKWETEKDLNWKMFGRQLNGRVTCWTLCTGCCW